MSLFKKKKTKEKILDFTIRIKKKWQGINWNIFRCFSICKKSKRQQDDNIKTIDEETKEQENCVNSESIQVVCRSDRKNKDSKVDNDDCQELSNIQVECNTPPSSPISENNNQSNLSYVSDVEENWITISKE
jgi:hypothetical protein